MLTNAPADSAALVLRQGSGMVVFSLTARGGDGLAVGVFSDQGEFSGAIDYAAPPQVSPAVFVGGQRLVEKPVGRLVVLLLNPGHYQIPGWEGTIPGVQQPMHVGGPIRGRFQLNPGEILYIGNLHVEFPGGNFKLTDQEERDLALFRRLYPALDETAVQKALLRIGPSRGAAGQG